MYIFAIIPFFIMECVKFGCIGGGIAARFHLAACKNSSKVKFTGIYEKDKKNTQRIAKAYRLTPYDTLLKSDVDAVLVAVPHFLHEEMVVAVAAAGKHVLCEKPMATTLEGCDLMIGAAKKVHVKFMIAENHRFLPAHQWIKEAVQKGWIGDPFLVRSYEGVDEIPNLMQPDSWKGHPLKAGGGALMDMGVHKFATMQWILNDRVESAYAVLTKQCTTLKEKAEDNAMMQIQFKRGVIGEMVVSFTVVTPPTNQIEIHGTQGTILENHSWEKPVKINSLHADLGENRGRWFEPAIEHGTYPKYYDISARKEDEYFASCILEDKDPEFTPEQAKEAVAAVLIGYLSAIQGRPASYNELMEKAHTIGTKFILENLLKAIKNNSPSQRDDVK
jgi:predicted dehydrogenase